MTETAAPPKQPVPATAHPAASKAGIDKAQSWVTFASTAAGVVGALGTGAVWLIANFYTGSVEVKSDLPLESVVVKVYDSKGKENTFHSRSLQLMPGSYHLEVVLPDGRSKHFDTDVKFGETSSIPLTLSDTPSTSAPSSKSSAPADSTSDTSGKKRWFQFWRKSSTRNDGAGG